MTPSPPAAAASASAAVVGAGAAGLMAAITAARARPGDRIVLLEGARRPGAKILVSGGGRCNVTNVVVKPTDFHGERRTIARVLDRFDADDTVRWFHDLGLGLVAEAETGKLFPASDRARDVLDALLGAAARAGVELVTAFRVGAVRRCEGGFEVEAADGRRVACARLVLATGGLALPKSGSDGTGLGIARTLGHTVTPLSPALVPLVLEPHPFPDLAGVSFPAAIAAWRERRRVAAVEGPALITHFGISGPAALDVSRHWTTAAPGAVELRLSFFPGRTAAALDREWLALAGAGGRTVSSLLEALPARLAQALAARAGVEAQLPLSRLTAAARTRLLAAATDLSLPVTASRGFAGAEVTAGGVPLAEVDVRRMTSRRVPGLHLIGEMLDVDGRIGGFNFQWAWSTGHIAGLALG